MTIQEREANLLNEAKALAYFFGVTSDKLSAAFILFSSLYEAPIMSALMNSLTHSMRLILKLKISASATRSLRKNLKS